MPGPARVMNLTTFRWVLLPLLGCLSAQAQYVWERMFLMKSALSRRHVGKRLGKRLSKRLHLQNVVVSYPGQTTTVSYFVHGPTHLTKGGSSDGWGLGTNIIIGVLLSL